MAKFLTTTDATSEIEKIINNAKSRLILISPFVRIPQNLFQNLKIADSKKVRITLVYGKRELQPDVSIQLGTLENLSLRYLENLHAKCFYNEESMVITSLNLYDFSEKNREMGVLVTAEDDQEFFNEAVQEANRIVSLSTTKDFGKANTRSYPTKIRQNGYCIRRRESIPFDLDKPFCRDCFLEWDEWGNPYYEEHYCHTCGKPALTTKAEPQCPSCYRESRR